MQTRLTVDFFADITCPWCLVAAVRLDKALALLPSEVAVEVVRHPYLIDPDLPASGINTRARLVRRYGHAADAAWAHIEGEARLSGLLLDLARQPMAYPTEMAHTLVRRATRQTQHHLATAIASAHFFDAARIDDPEGLAGIATRFGFSTSDALAVVTDEAELEETRIMAQVFVEQGLKAVPFIEFNGNYPLSGCEPEAIFRRAVMLAVE